MGFRDWQDFCQRSEDSGQARDHAAIENMGVFFRNGKKYRTDYYRNTSTVATLNDYADVIYRTRENTEYFYELYGHNSWATDYIFCYIPNYNLYGQDWFRAMMLDKYQRSDCSHIRLALNNFLYFGAFLAEDNVSFVPTIVELRKNYEAAVKDHGYLPYHEMRYHTILLIHARKTGSAKDFRQICRRYLQGLDAQAYTEVQKAELIVFFCNTLVWLEEYETAYGLLKTYVFREGVSLMSEPLPLHFSGICPAFVNVTAELIMAMNGDSSGSGAATGFRDLDLCNATLYRDYISMLDLILTLKREKRQKNREKILEHLEELARKTNYSRPLSVAKNILIKKN